MTRGAVQPDQGNPVPSPSSRLGGHSLGRRRRSRSARIPDPDDWAACRQRRSAETRQIQYGIPTRSSVPTEPYLKWVRMSAAPGSGWRSPQAGCVSATSPATTSAPNTSRPCTLFIFALSDGTLSTPNYNFQLPRYGRDYGVEDEPNKPVGFWPHPVRRLSLSWKLVVGRCHRIHSSSRSLMNPSSIRCGYGRAPVDRLHLQG